MQYKKTATRFNWLSVFQRRSLLLGMIGVSLGLLLATPLVHAIDYQAQINDLSNKNSLAETALGSLQSTATSYQDALNQLQAQISAIQAAIGANTAEQATLAAQIAADEAQVAQNKTYLADDIKTMYVDAPLSTIEQLANSQNLSAYVDKQDYRNVVQNKIDDLLNTIQTTQAATQVHKDSVAVLLQTETQQQAQIAADQAQQNQLLSDNQAQQSQFNQQIATNNSQISSLRKAQAAANASIARSARVSVSASSGAGGACDIGQGNGGYPYAWCNADQDSINDSYGFPVRECTSFAYWYFVTQEGQSNFRVSGNAGWWWETSNYPVTTYPVVKVGAIGIEPSSSLNAPVPSLHGGYYGHVMIVKALPGQNYPGYGTVPDGYVLVASMNEDEAGHFIYNLWPVNYLMFVNPQ